MKKIFITNMVGLFLLVGCGGGEVSNTPLPTADRTAPNISNLSVIVSTTSAVVSWDTNEASNSQVQYGTTMTYGVNVSDAASVTSHRVSLTGLSTGTTYHYRVNSTDVAGNVATTTDSVFTTTLVPPPPDTNAPVISNIIVTNVTATSATISWTTNENASTQVQYGLNTNYGVTINGDANMLLHSVTLNGLSANTLYHFRVVSTDVANNTTQSADAMVTTLRAVDTMSPTVSLTSPIGGNVYGTVSVTANANDDVAVAGVQFHVNGQSLGNEDTTAPYGVNWDTSGLTPGSIQTLTAYARDAAGNTTTSAAVQVTVQATPTDSLTQGYDAANQRLIAANVVLDLARPAAGNYPAWTSRIPYDGMVRNATHQVLSGGYFGRGFSRFSPGHVIDNNRGEHYCGIGQIHGFADVGDSTRVVIGQLVRFGTTFFSDMASDNTIYGDIKDIVLINDSCQPPEQPNCRPMMNTKGSSPNSANNFTPTRVMGACKGTVCNTTGDPNDVDWFNERGNEPNIDRYRGEWLWIEFAFNSNAPQSTRTRVWSADGYYQGAEIISGEASPGRVTALDIIGFVNAIPNPGAQPYYDLERIEIRIGSDAAITPPVGFPGSAR